MESSGPYFVSNQSKYSDTKLNYPNLHIAKPSASKVIKFLLEGVDSSMWKKLDIFCKKKGLFIFWPLQTPTICPGAENLSVCRNPNDRLPIFCPYAHSSWEGVSIFNDGYLTERMIFPKSGPLCKISADESVFIRKQLQLHSGREYCSMQLIS